jgi:hypothetical protein
MLERATETAAVVVPAPRQVGGSARFARDPGEYATGRGGLRLVHRADAPTTGREG